MTREEFKERVKGFLPTEAIDRYEEIYEPAYMVLANIDKDDFCKALKNSVTNIVIVRMSQEIRDCKSAIQQVKKQLADETAKYQHLVEMITKAAKSLKLIQATVDRAFGELPCWASEV